MRFARLSLITFFVHLYQWSIFFSCHSFWQLYRPLSTFNTMFLIVPHNSLTLPNCFRFSVFQSLLSPMFFSLPFWKFNFWQHQIIIRSDFLALVTLTFLPKQITISNVPNYSTVKMETTVTFDVAFRAGTGCWLVKNHLINYENPIEAESPWLNYYSQYGQ